MKHIQFKSLSIIRVAIIFIALISLFEYRVIPLSQTSAIELEKLVDYTKEIGLTSAPINTSTFAKPCVGDLNTDGINDIFWSEHRSDIANIYIGTTASTFTRKNNTGITKNDNHGCLIADFDRDGDNDIFAPIGACEGTCFKRDKLWLHNKNGQFKSSEWLMGAATKDRSRSANLIDVNNDGWTDILITASAKAGGYSHHRIMINKGLKNNKWVGFSETAMGIERAHGNSDCSAVGDFNTDGWDDILICEDDKALMYQNNRGSAFELLIQPFSLNEVRGASTEDVNQDGLDDLLLAKVGMLELRYQTVGGGYNELPDFTQTLVHGYEVVTPDLNGDGFKDIYVVQALSKQDPSTDGAHMAFIFNNQSLVFERIMAPQPNNGAGDKAVVLPDFMQSGKDAVLVGNGGQWDTKGPRQVVAFSIL